MRCRLPDCRPKGVAAVNLLQLQPEERITSLVGIRKNDTGEGYLFMTTTNGTVKNIIKGLQ